jgi:hypothetical protein
MAFYVGYCRQLSCSSGFCTLYVPPMYPLLLKNVRGGHKNPKIAKKIQNLPKKLKATKKPHKSQNMPNVSKKSKKIQKGFLCSLRGLCYLQGLLGLLCLSHSVTEQGQKQVIGGTKIGPR